MCLYFPVFGPFFEIGRQALWSCGCTKHEKSINTLKYRQLYILGTAYSQFYSWVALYQTPSLLHNIPSQSGIHDKITWQGKCNMVTTCIGNHKACYTAVFVSIKWDGTWQSRPDRIHKVGQNIVELAFHNKVLNRIWADTRFVTCTIIKISLFYHAIVKWYF